MTMNIVLTRNIFRATCLHRSIRIGFIQNTSTNGSRKDKLESTSSILSAACVAGLALERVACVLREDKPTSQNPFVKLDVYLEPISFEIPRKFVIELRGAVVGVEGIDPEFSYGERVVLLLAGGPATMTISGSRQINPRSLPLPPCAYVREARSLGRCHAWR